MLSSIKNMLSENTPLLATSDQEVRYNIKTTKKIVFWMQLIFTLNNCILDIPLILFCQTVHTFFYANIDSYAWMYVFIFIFGGICILFHTPNSVPLYITEMLAVFSWICVLIGFRLSDISVFFTFLIMSGFVMFEISKIYKLFTLNIFLSNCLLSVHLFPSTMISNCPQSAGFKHGHVSLLVRFVLFFIAYIVCVNLTATSDYFPVFRSLSVGLVWTIVLLCGITCTLILRKQFKTQPIDTLRRTLNAPRMPMTSQLTTQNVGVNTYNCRMLNESLFGESLPPKIGNCLRQIFLRGIFHAVYIRHYPRGLLLLNLASASSAAFSACFVYLLLPSLMSKMPLLPYGNQLPYLEILFCLGLVYLGTALTEYLVAKRLDVVNPNVCLAMLVALGLIIFCLPGVVLALLYSSDTIARVILPSNSVHRLRLFSFSFHAANAFGLALLLFLAGVFMSLRDIVLCSLLDRWTRLAPSESVALSGVSMTLACRHLLSGLAILIAICQFKTYGVRSIYVETQVLGVVALTFITVLALENWFVRANSGLFPEPVYQNTRSSRLARSPALVATARRTSQPLPSGYQASHFDNLSSPQHRRPGGHSAMATALPTVPTVHVSSGYGAVNDVAISEAYKSQLNECV